MATSLTLNVNGVDRTVSVPSTNMPLLWALRDIVGLTGTKYGCGIEVCGACTVLVTVSRRSPATWMSARRSAARS
jgi:aerobic-type carbon monoxide dehydrogenase small subunit (CoxS/CutS family)